jgi:superfamily II helicase
MLRRLIKAGTEPDAIAVRLGRTPRAVRMQVARIYKAIDDIIATCTRCHEEKPLKDFVIDKRATNGHGSICKSCRKEMARQYRKQQREKMERLRQIVEGDGKDDR